ncbi:MAG: phosphoribosylaminoimidazolecarboxamide formyltransferase [Firmicutes bacterium]|nr:phosphoribosylaminoimidazolecarboxamide formyltransferase [Bacillota bacterium]
MKEFLLKYGANPNQYPARIFMEEGELPLKILNGHPGYINFLDALNAWQLVSELKETLKLPSAASFKHVSPAGAAVGLPLSAVLQKAYQLPAEEILSPLASAYARARGADRLCSFGDWIALSDTCDVSAARLIAREVSDGIIAPGYEEEALIILKNKRKGNYNIVDINPDYRPPQKERRQVFGVSFEEGRNEARIDESWLQNVVTALKELLPTAKRDLIIALITLKYTQSNSVCYALDGQAIGVGAGQQSRIHCTRLAGDKADNWQLRQHPQVLNLPFKPETPRPVKDNAIDRYISRTPQEVLAEGIWQNLFSERPEVLLEEQKQQFLSQMTGVALGSDAFFPFADNINRAAQSGVRYIAQPGGSIRDGEVIEACDKLGIAMAFTGLRLFHH